MLFMCCIAKHVMTSKPRPISVQSTFVSSVNISLGLRVPSSFANGSYSWQHSFRLLW